MNFRTKIQHYNQQLNTNQIYPNNPTAAFPNAQDYYRSLNDGSRLPSTTEVPMIPTVISTTCESIQTTTTHTWLVNQSTSNVKSMVTVDGAEKL